MKRNKFSTWTFFILFLLSLLLVIHLLFNFITPMIISLMLVSLFSPLHEMLRKIFPKSIHCTALFSTILVFLGVIIPLGLFILAIGREAINVYHLSSQFSDSPEFSL